MDSVPVGDMLSFTAMLRVRQRRHAARSRVARGYWDCGGRALPRADAWIVTRLFE